MGEESESNTVFIALVAMAVLYLIHLYNTRPQPKKVDPRFAVYEGGPPEKPDENRVFTAEELAKYTGSNDEFKRIYIGCKGKVYDVTDSGFYDPNSTYNKAFAGRDASYDLAKMDLEVKHPATEESIASLSESEIATMTQWDDKFASKYDLMGIIENSPFHNKKKD